MIDEEEGVPHYYKHSKICFLSNFPPKECGIATFTKDLVNAMDQSYNAKLKSQVIARNEETDFYNYDHRVVMQINKETIEQLFRQHYLRMYQLARVLLKDDAASKDVVS